MRVAIFTDNDFDKINGVTTALAALIAHAPPDISPRIYTAARLSTDAADYLALRSIPVPIPFYRTMKMYVPRWREYLRRTIDDRIDVLHVTTPGPIGLAALWIAARTHLPLVGSFHTDLAAYTTLLSGSETLGRLMERYLRWVYGHCRPVLVPSAATRDLLVANGVHAERIRLWLRGVDTTLFSPERRSADLRERWHASDRRPAVLYVGRISREKGIELLPPMMRRLAGFGIPHRLVVVGDGPQRVWLSEQCPDAIFTGCLGREDVANTFASADLFVFPSRTDTAGNVVLEAQASGLPVLVSDVGGPQEQMIPGHTGVVCSGTDAARWAATAAHLLSDSEMRRSLSQAARRYALNRGWGAALEPVYQAYRDAAPGGTAAAVHHAA